MKIELIAIGSEILSGNTVNTNVSFIGQELIKAGFPIHRHTVLPDDAVELRKGLQEALKRSSIVICTGGLGPTLDDITRQAAAELFHSDFYIEEKIVADLKKRFGDKLTSLKDQATIPSKATFFMNTVGTAPGLAFSSGDSLLILVPGVPLEMRQMITHQVIPYLSAGYSISERQYSEVLYFCDLPESAVDPTLRRLKEQNPQIDYGIYPAHGTLSVRLTTRAVSGEKGHALLQPSCKVIAGEFAEHLYDSPSGAIEEAVQLAFISKGLTLSVAESCTGGALAARITRISGASQYFMGGVVSYSNQLKMDLLGVPRATLEKYGAVSEEAVCAMVTGLLERTKTDYGVAVSGVAGPTGGTPEKPVGTIWAAICRRGEVPFSWSYSFPGNREKIIDLSVNRILSKLWTAIR